MEIQPICPQSGGESIVYKSLLKKKHNVDVISVSEPLVDGPFGSLIPSVLLNGWMNTTLSDCRAKSQEE